MLAASFLSKLRRNRVCVRECLFLASGLIAMAFAIHEFNLSRGFELDRETMICEWLIVEVATIGGFTVFTWRRIQEKEREIAKRMRSEQQARRLAHQDPLTKLANRRQFYKTLNAAVSSASADGAHALLLLDLNGFKQINDQFGHRAGDVLLVLLAKRLTAAMRDGETVARLGGDEFAVIGRNASGLEGARDLAARILKCLQEPLLVGSVNHRLGLAVGIALTTRDRVKSDELLRRADVALYKAKAMGGSTVAVYRSEIDKTREEIVDPDGRVEFLLQGVSEAQSGAEQRKMASPPRLKLVG